MPEIRRWQINSGGKEHIVEYVIRARGNGEIMVDGKVGVTLSSMTGYPRTMEFEIDGKAAMLRRTGGILSPHYDLIYEGNTYTEKQGRL